MIKELKTLHESTPVPDELKSNLENIIEKDTQKIVYRKKRKKRLSLIAISALSACIIVMFVFVNTSYVFAQSLQNIPILNKLCSILTIREYKEDDQFNYINVKVPSFINNYNNELEKKVNNKIKLIIENEITDSKERAREYYDAYIETGGNKNDFTPINVNISYNIKSICNDLASFVIYKIEDFFSVYNDYYYYNIDLNTGRELTLKDLLGDNYKHIVSEQITNQIELWDEDDKKFVFENVEIEQLLNNNTRFYINKDRKIVVVFEKYTITSGVYGRPEFVIDCEIIK